jgi:RNA polymerase sigma-70 factor, ECF subfamily
MSQLDWLAGRFQDSWSRLRSMAYRMLGSAGDADDGVQEETWLWVSRADADDVGTWPYG